MAIKIIKRTYYNQFNSSSKETDWLLGNTGDWQRLDVTFDAKVEFEASTTETVTVDSKNNIFKLNNGKSWQSYGFDIGDSISLTWIYGEDLDGDSIFNETDNYQVYTIKLLYKDTMEIFQSIDFDQFSIIPTDRGNTYIKDVKFSGTKDIEGVKFRYGHITNDNYNSGTLNSFIDGTITEFSYAGLNNLQIEQQAQMNATGVQSGMAIQSMFVSKAQADAALTLLIGGSVNSSISTVKNLTSRLYRSGAISVNMTALQAGPNIQSQVEGILPSNGSEYTNLLNSDQAFLNRATLPSTRAISVVSLVKVTEIISSATNSTLSLVLVKYSGGSSYNYVSTTVLTTVSNVPSYLNKSIPFVGARSLDVQPGESYVLALQLTRVSYSQTLVKLDVLYSYVIEIPLSLNYYYKISTNFMIASFFENVQNLEDRQPPSNLFNAGSLTDNFEIEVFPTWNNPNTTIKNDLSVTERLGNTGWFNENFNGLKNKFKVESIKYLDKDFNATSQLDYANEINVEIIVSGLNNLSTASEFSLGFAWIPQNQEDYQNKETPFHKNLLINTGKEILLGMDDRFSFNLDENTGNQIYLGYTYGDPRMDMKATDSIIFKPIGGGKVLVKAKFIPNASFTDLMESKDESDRKYILWVSVADPLLQINFSDRVSLLVEYNDMVKTISIQGEYPGLTNRFLEHPQDENAPGKTEYFGFLQDDVLSRVEFRADNNSIDIIRNISFGYEVVNKTTGSKYTLEEIPVNLTKFPKDFKGIQQIDYDSTRGFKLEDGNNKNLVKIKRNILKDDLTSSGYIAYFASKIRWEDWIQRDNVPSEFFNNSLEYDGKNNNWINYLRAGKGLDYDVNFFIYIDVFSEGESRRYNNSFKINFNAYDENLNITKDHFYYRDSTNELLNSGVDAETGKPLGLILSNEYTRIEILYTHLTENFDIQKMYATITLEIDKGAGELEMRQISSIYLSEFDNPLIPLTGETKLKFEQLSPTVIKASCLIDPNKLEKVIRYRITGRIGCFKEGDSTSVDGIYENLYENLYE